MWKCSRPRPRLLSPGPRPRPRLGRVLTCLAECSPRSRPRSAPGPARRMGHQGPAEEEPETLYSPGAEGRPQVGFKLEELMNLIREVLAENV